jgi:hypothetical protein
LTALAIAGGVYYRGIEGALMGPIVLCCLLVGIRLYNETMARTLSENHESIVLSATQRTRLSRRSQSLPTIMIDRHHRLSTGLYQQFNHDL